ncbi:sigma-E factor negative regulatory protein [Halieaceae bacterium]|nr:sigma-E factor negative regulatory protein [Halieaceae bacterium]
MSEQLRESLSALMDDEANELEVERVLARIDSDVDMRTTWMRYHRTRDALAGHDRISESLDISAAVMVAIRENPGLAQRSPLNRLLRPVASFAVAASVAATVVFGGQQLAQLGTVDVDESRTAYASGVSPVGMINAVGATPMRASFGTRPVPALQPATNQAYGELARQRLKQYSQQHAEHAALNTPQGLIPFARVPRISEE